ncbi:MAG TPA: DUF1906 domain-containing protein [Nocardioides sp.]|nr:DUF1906 domain-containing protein [Nocardioides sp.]
MPAPSSSPVTRPVLLRPVVARTAVVALVALLAAALLVAPRLSGTDRTSYDLSAARRSNPVTPGNFLGYGFDQCQTQSQAKMDAWLAHSPYRAVGVYISGASRFCRTQPNLTPGWVSTQLAKGWRILPITLGPQSTCVGRFPRYGKTIDPTISNNATDGYRAALRQGKIEAKRAVTVARSLGIVGSSTLWYDLEGWSNHRDVTCRESALAFLSGWTRSIRKYGYVSGVYSSAGSGLRVLDKARSQRRTDVTLPDQIWIARWDGVANTSTSYLAEDGWNPGRRMKQYRGGHNETWGGATINIDSSFLRLGNGTTSPSYCGTLASYGKITPATSVPQDVRMLKCRLREQLLYSGKMGKKYNSSLRSGIHAFQRQAGQRVKDNWTRSNWTRLLAIG